MRSEALQDAISLWFSELLQSTSPSKGGIDSLNRTSRTRNYTKTSLKTPEFFSFGFGLLITLSHGFGNKRQIKRRSLEICQKRRNVDGAPKSGDTSPTFR